MLRSSPSPVATVVLVAVPLAVLPAPTPGLVWALVLVLDAVDDDGSPSLVDGNQHLIALCYIPAFLVEATAVPAASAHLGLGSRICLDPQQSAWRTCRGWRRSLVMFHCRAPLPALRPARVGIRSVALQLGPLRLWLCHVSPGPMLACGCGSLGRPSAVSTGPRLLGRYLVLQGSTPVWVHGF